MGASVSMVLPRSFQLDAVCLQLAPFISYIGKCSCYKLFASNYFTVNKYLYHNLGNCNSRFVHGATFLLAKFLVVFVAHKNLLWYKILFYMLSVWYTPTEVIKGGAIFVLTMSGRSLLCIREVENA